MERAAVVKRFAELISERQEECAIRLTRDTGKPITQSRNEVRATVKRAEYFSSAAESALAEREIKASAKMNERIRYEPLGVVANISAWNYPYFVGLNVWAPALLAGNGVVYKGSEHAAGTSRLVHELWLQAGAPCFVTVEPDRATGPALVDADVDGIFFTGSCATGREIASRAAPRMIKLQLELGGKDAVYVADDVQDTPQVAAAVADGAFYNSGQSCCSVERIYVHEKVYDDFIASLVNTVNSFRVGSEWDPNTFVGPLCLPTQPIFLRRQLDDALAKGATQLTGFAVPPTPRHFSPTVLVDVDHTMDIVQTESFGPIVAVAKVTDDDHALRLVNDSSYGLTASIYSSDRDRALSFLSQTKTGSAYWNCCDRTSPYLPWSGRRASGIGITMSDLGISTFAHARGYHLAPP